MFFQIDNHKIGAYISGLIEREFKSARQFCIAYLQTEGMNEPTRDDIQRMANRLSQIVKGAKAIQIYDLPIFSELLHVSFEQILSAGKCSEVKNNRMTNYTIAQSYNEEEWTAYIEEKENPILNPDEYGKTVLDYAIMFGNYDFLKFLVNKNYIWFDSRKDLLFVAAQWPEQRIMHLSALAKARAIENQMFLALCNSVGVAGETRCGGHSAVIDPWGEALAQAWDGEEIICGEADFSVLQGIRDSINVFRDRRPELYSVS